MWRLPLLLACAMAPARAEEPKTLPAIEVTAEAAALPAAPEQLPVSATRVGREALADAQYQVNLSESLGRVPGLVANNRQNYAQDLQLSIRGFGARAAFGVRGLRLYTDGIPATMPDGQGQVSHFDLIGAERITVLRGPYSALYGASSGGVIELSSREPEQSFVEASGWAGADALQRYALGGARADEGWSALGAASWFDTTGYRRHSAATRAGAQARLALGPTHDLLLLANTLDLEAQDPLGLTRAQWQDDPEQAGANALAYDTRKRVRQSQAGVAWTPMLGPASALRLVAWTGKRDTIQFQSIPDTVQGTIATNPTHPGGVIDLARIYFGADLRWLGRARVAGGPLQLAVGADAEFLDEHRQGFQNFTGEPGPDSIKGVKGGQRRDEDTRAATYDPYLQADWQFARDWRALLGLRHADVHVRSEDRFVIAGNGDDSGAARFQAWLPVAGLHYAPGVWRWHAALSRGAETPTLNELAYRSDGTGGLNTQLRASRSTNLEIGGQWRSEAARAELVLFGIDTRDEIVVAASSGGRTTFANAAGTRREGAEASLEWQLAPAWSALVSGTLLQARYDAGTASGRRLPGVPRENAFAEVAWRAPGGPLRVALEGLFRGAVSVNDAGTDAAPGYAVLNLRAVLPLRGGLEIVGRVDNLRDRRYAGSVIVNESNGRYFEPAPGLGVGIGLRWTPP